MITSMKNVYYKIAFDVFLYSLIFSHTSMFIHSLVGYLPKCYYLYLMVICVFLPLWFSYCCNILSKHHIFFSNILLWKIQHIEKLKEMYNQLIHTHHLESKISILLLCLLHHVSPHPFLLWSNILFWGVFQSKLKTLSAITPRQFSMQIITYSTVLLTDTGGIGVRVNVVREMEIQVDPGLFQIPEGETRKWGEQTREEKKHRLCNNLLRVVEGCHEDGITAQGGGGERERWMKGRIMKFRAARFRVWGQQKHGAYVGSK